MPTHNRLQTNTSNPKRPVSAPAGVYADIGGATESLCAACGQRTASAPVGLYMNTSGTPSRSNSQTSGATYKSNSQTTAVNCGVSAQRTASEPVEQLYANVCVVSNNKGPLSAQKDLYMNISDPEYENTNPGSQRRVDIYVNDEVFLATEDMYEEPLSSKDGPLYAELPGNRKTKQVVQGQRVTFTPGSKVNQDGGEETPPVLPPRGDLSPRSSPLNSAKNTPQLSKKSPGGITGALLRKLKGNTKKTYKMREIETCANDGKNTGDISGETETLEETFDQSNVDVVRAEPLPDYDGAQNTDEYTFLYPISKQKVCANVTDGWNSPSSPRPPKPGAIPVSPLGLGTGGKGLTGHVMVMWSWRWSCD